MPQPTPPTMTIRLTLEPFDTIHAYQLHTRDQLWRKAAVLTLVTMLALEAVALWVALPGQWLGLGVILAASMLGALVFPRLMIRFYVPRVARRIYGQQKALQQPIEVAFEAGGLRTTASFGSSYLPWADYRKMREDERVMLFYQSDALFQFVPKRFLPGSQVDVVRRLYAEGRAQAGS